MSLFYKCSLSIRCGPCNAAPIFDTVLRLNFRERFQKDSGTSKLLFHHRDSYSFSDVLAHSWDFNPLKKGQIQDSRLGKLDLCWPSFTGGFGDHGPDLSVFIKGGCGYHLNLPQELG